MHTLFDWVIEWRFLQSCIQAYFYTVMSHVWRIQIAVEDRKLFIDKEFHRPATWKVVSYKLRHFNSYNPLQLPTGCFKSSNVLRREGYSGSQIWNTETIVRGRVLALMWRVLALVQWKYLSGPGSAQTMTQTNKTEPNIADYVNCF